MTGKVSRVSDPCHHLVPQEMLKNANVDQGCQTSSLQSPSKKLLIVCLVVKTRFFLEWSNL